MLDFATLNQAKQGLAKSDQQRHQQSAELYAQGRQLIRESLGDVIHKAKLKQATDCFSKGIQLNYKNPDNYLGMGFLFLLLSQPREALPYLKTALELKPDSELGLELLRQAQRVATPGSVAPLPSTPPPIPSTGIPQNSRDYDDLYDATEAALMLALKTVMSDPILGCQPAPDTAQLQQIHSQLALYQGQVAHFNHQLQILDEEIEVSDLRSSLGMIDRALQRLVTQASLFGQFVTLAQDIQQHQEQALALTEAAHAQAEPAQIAALEMQAQVLLDHCDHVADQLDAIDAKGVDIGPLQPLYQAYVGQLEALQDALE
jgi:tetratricopeptide (TPR) repeat protein